MKHAKPTEKFALKLTAAEHTLLRAIRLPPAFERLIDSTSPSEPLMLLPDSLVALGVYVGAAAHHTPDLKAKHKITAISQKILQLLSDVRSIREARMGHEPRKTAPTKIPTRTRKRAECLYQFKITLLDIEPPIWRRIQVEDCTLDKLHEHIQTVMGWTNSHLHQFKINDHLYGDPMLMEENFEEMDFRDSTRTKLSKLVPKTGKRFRFEYEYDFGDGWQHEVLFEGCVQAEPGRKYPLCLEGERACPPEDVGGTSGYEEFLEAIIDRRHERHKELLGWSGGSFDPEAFDSAEATKAMKKGLPDWRNEEWF